MQTEPSVSKVVFINTGGVMSTASGAHLLVHPNDITLSATILSQAKRTLPGSSSTVSMTLTRVTSKGARELPPIPDDHRYVELPVKVAPLGATFTKGCTLRVYHGMHANHRALRVVHFLGLPAREWTFLPSSAYR
jgi:hypothetical protein